MFGFSLTKLVFTVLVVMAVWYGFKWVSRLQQVREAQARESLRRGGPSAPRHANPPAGDAEDMVKCKVCDSYVTANGAVSCGRSDCPYPG